MKNWTISDRNLLWSRFFSFSQRLLKGIVTFFIISIWLNNIADNKTVNGDYKNGIETHVCGTNGKRKM